MKKSVTTSRSSAAGGSRPRSTASTTRAEQSAARILEACGIDALPVAVDTIALHLGLAVQKTVLGDDVSGVLVIHEGRGVIGVNVHQSLSRQRFTIAHECGHFTLHRDKLPVFIDKQFLGAYFAAYRNSASSTGEHLMEREANAFAAALLMPAKLLAVAISELPSELPDDDAIESLAKQCQVSKQAMSFRLANLATTM